MVKGVRSEMWTINKNGNSEVWTTSLCRLEIEYKGINCRILVDYKSYNVIFAMGLWGFEEEIQERNIDYDIVGEKGNFATLRYVVKKEDLSLFCDLIYFFLAENNLDRVLSDAYKL